MKKCLALLLAAALLLCLVGCKSGESDQDAQNETDSDSETDTQPTWDLSVKTADAGERTMNYISFGKGEKSFIILPGISVHSVLGSGEAIAAAYSAFCDDYTIYVFDRANDMPQGYTVRDMAEDTAKAMQSLGIENADIFGASQGGMIELYLAIDHPELVHAMVLGSTLARGNDTISALIDEWIELAENKNETGLLESFADNVYSQATLDAYRDTLISSNLGITDGEYERFIIQAEACKSFDCYDELGSVSCPALVLGSEGDRVVTAQGSKDIAEALGCEIYLYDESYGHGVYDEAPDYRQRCLDFFASTYEA